jgi:hypothetical protein
MKTVYSREGDFLVQGAWQVPILLYFFLPFNYQPAILNMKLGEYRGLVGEKKR